MSTASTNADNLEIHDFERPRLTTTLNVLTILTFIGCALQLLITIWSFISSEETYRKKDEVLAQMNSGEVPGWAKNMMGDPEHFEQLVTKSFENRVPILLLGIVALGLCFYGALQMRKLKKQGFIIYVIGEFLPFITMAAFIGTFSFSGFGFFFSLAIAVIFTLLYITQRKNLVY